MKKITLLLNVFILFSFIMISCSEDDSSSNSIELEGGVIYKAQVVTLQIINVDINQQEYIGYLDGNEINLYKSAENQLIFMVPLNISNGKQDLTIPGLRDAVIHYTVNETTLSQTAEETLIPFFSNLNVFELALDDSPEAVNVQNTINSFNTYYSSATDEEKEAFAVIYKANKSSIDEIFTDDYSHITGRSLFPNAVTNVLRHKKSVAVMAIGCGVMFTGNPILGGLVAIAGAYKAYKANEETVDLLSETISTEFDGVTGTADRSSNDNVLLQNNRATQVNFKFIERKIISSDSNKTEPLAVTYFTSFNTYNYLANKCNLIINTTNDFFGTSFSNMLIKVLNDSNPSVTIPVTQAMFNRMTFSISHPNLQLVSKSLSSEGVLSIVVKMIGSPTALFIHSDLKYTYSDDFTKFDGQIPIDVIFNIEGSWRGLTYNEFTIGEQKNYSVCGVFTGFDLYSNSSLVFTKVSSGHYSAIDRLTGQYYFNGNYINPDTCELTSMTVSNETYQFTATYDLFYSGNGVYQVTYPGSSDLNSYGLTILDENKIQIVVGGNIGGTKTYIRN